MKLNLTTRQEKNFNVLSQWNDDDNVNDDKEDDDCDDDSHNINII